MYPYKIRICPTRSDIEHISGGPLAETLMVTGLPYVLITKKPWWQPTPKWSVSSDPYGQSPYRRQCQYGQMWG